MSASSTLAIDGGAPAKQQPDPPMYPGGMMIDEEEEQAVLDVLRSKRLFRYYGPTPGPSRVEELEQAFARLVGTQYALAVSSGTGALLCALQGLGIGPGDEVIVPAYTWIASAAAVVAMGGIPVLAEVDQSLTLDPADVEHKITPYTRAIMPVHMRGVPCRMDELLALARSRSLKVIEDAAQANGGSYHGRRLGSLGDAGCFSLQFNKIITAGEGGMVVANNTTVWKRAVMYHDVVGGLRNQFPTEEILWGINLRMPELLAAVMLVQLRRLDALVAAMRERKRAIIAGITDTCARKGIMLQVVPDPEGDASVSLIFLMPTPEIAHKVVAALASENVKSSVIYRPDKVDYHIYSHWTPIMRKRTWTAAGGPWRWAQRPVVYTPDMCPRTLGLLGRAIHLDVNPLYTEEDVAGIVAGVNKVLNALL